MLNIDTLAQSASCKNLRRLFWLRGVMIACLCLTVLSAGVLFELPLPVMPIIAILGLLALLNLGTWLRLRHARHITDIELLLQLLADILLLSILFYNTGGYTNPFVWMYLLPITVAAVALPWTYTWAITALSIINYSLLMFSYIPLPHQHHHHDGSGDFSMHLLGMWFGFVVSAGIIAFFVARIGNNLRDYDRMMAEAREKALESERMLALGTLAAAAAHELGTPLSTMAVLSKELSQAFANDTVLVKKLALLRTQVDRCKDILGSIAASAGHARAEDGQGEALDVFLNAIIKRWHDTRPATQLDCTLSGSTPIPSIAVDRTLGQALVNLLDNAADASQTIKVNGTWNAQALTLTIRDHGVGLSIQHATQIGTPFFTTKQDQGLGLGLYLARAIIERFGGSVQLSNHPQGGGLAAVSLPLGTLTIGEPPK